jgi:hypothetical protein
VPRRSSSNWVGPSSLAPSDVLLGNPVALKRAFSKAAVILVLGLRDSRIDLRFEEGMPS